MRDAALASDLARERSRAVRSLLAAPLLDIQADPDAFRLVIAHAAWLADWFQTSCGWTLVVDAAAGFARLAKRSASVEGDRPLHRSRGSGAAFDRRRYQLLCLVCAELVRHPVTTIGLLAAAITAEAGLDTTKQHERAAFVDALLVLTSWGALRITAGDVEVFVGDRSSNAILTADTARLHRLLVSATAPAALPDALTTDAATAALQAEPRYGSAGSDPDEVEDEVRQRWRRHTLARRLLDDPVVHVEDLTEGQRDYLASNAGRRWLRERVEQAGMELEERADGLLAIDTDGLATDRHFPAPHGNAHQLALLLVDRLTALEADGTRRPVTLGPNQVRREVAAILERYPAWARSARDAGGPERLTADALALLSGFGLVRIDADETVVPRPAIARYRVGQPTVLAPQAALFEESLP